jgi:hypothetical protein
MVRRKRKRKSEMKIELEIRTNATGPALTVSLLSSLLAEGLEVETYNHRVSTKYYELNLEEAIVAESYGAVFAPQSILGLGGDTVKLRVRVEVSGEVPFVFEKKGDNGVRAAIDAAKVVAIWKAAGYPKSFRIEGGEAFPMFDAFAE